MNILIVDDDDFLVRKIADGITWEDYGIDYAFTANNIRQAKRILEEYPIQILLSDIEMPQGNGLELLQWVREQKLPVKFILLSSYAHFPYAQKALTLNTCEYLLKPVSNSELAAVIKKIADTIREEETEKDKNSLMHKNAFWMEFIMGNPRDKKNGNIADIYQEEELFQLLMIRMQSEEVKGKYKDNRMLSLNLQKTVSFLLEQNHAVLEGILEYGKFTWMVLYRVEQEPADEFNFMKRTKMALEESLETGLFLLGKRKMTPLVKIAETMEQLETLAQEAVIGLDDVLYLEDWQNKKNAQLKLNWEAISREFLFAEELLPLADRISGYLEDFWNQNQLTVAMLRHFYSEFMQMIFRWLEHKKLQFSQVFVDDEMDIHYQTASHSLCQMIDFVHWILQRIEVYQQAEDRQEKLVEKMQQYILGHLKEDLSRKTLANLVFLSEDYVSKIFTNTTGKSITGYITECRMDKAKEYLLETDWSVSQVAMQVGYTNFSYFSKMFRQVNGYTPNEFRSRFVKKRTE